MTAPSLALTARRFVVVLVVVALLSSTATAVVVQSLSFNPIVAGTGPLQSSGDIVLEDQDLLYTGTRVDGVNVTLNNTGSSAHDVDVQATLLNSTGDVLVEKTVATSIAATSVKTVTVDYVRANEPSINDVEDVEILLEVTG